MVKINLLPPEFMEERKKKTVQKKFLRGIGFFVAVLVLGFAFLFAATLQVKSDVQALGEERARVEAEVATYQPFVEVQNRVNSKSGLVQTAMGMQLSWRETLGSLGLHIPDNVWLTNVSVTMGENEGSLLLRGQTFDHPSTASWVAALSEIPGIRDVRTSFSAEEQEFVRFEMRASVDGLELFDPLAERGE